MIREKILLTHEGYNRMKKELDELVRFRRREVIERLKEALEFGHFEENMEYEDARSEQALIERRIAELEGILSRAEVIKKAKDNTIVRLGTRVVIENKNSGEIINGLIVSSVEADPVENKISNKSPVGSAIMGKRVGDEVKVKTPQGNQKYKILEISNHISTTEPFEEI